MAVAHLGTDPLTGLTAAEAKDFSVQEVADICLPTLKKSFDNYLAPKVYSAQLLFCAAVPDYVQLTPTPAPRGTTETAQERRAQAGNADKAFLEDLVCLCGGQQYMWHDQLVSRVPSLGDQRARLLDQMRAPLHQLHHEKLLFMHRLANFFWQAAGHACQVVVSLGAALDIGVNVIADFKSDIHAVEQFQKMLERPDMKIKRNLAHCNCATYMQMLTAVKLEEKRRWLVLEVCFLLHCLCWPIAVCGVSLPAANSWVFKIAFGDTDVLINKAMASDTVIVLQQLCQIGSSAELV